MFAGSLTPMHTAAIPIRSVTNPPGVQARPPASIASSIGSGTEAFETGIERRDGSSSCVICGVGGGCDHAHLVPKTDHVTWEELKRCNIIPRNAKGVAHGPRNSLLLCKKHHYYFDRYQFIIRYVPESKCFVFVNHYGYEELEASHGQRIRLDPTNPRCPFLALFWHHENLVRAQLGFQRQDRL